MISVHGTAVLLTVASTVLAIATGPLFSATPPMKERLLANDEEELRKQLSAVPELRLFPDEDVKNAKKLLGSTTFMAKLHQDMVMTGVREGLPLRSGIQAQMNSVAAKVMGTLSTELRTKGFVSIPGVPGSPLRGTKPQSSPTDKAGIFREWCDQNNIEKFSGALPTLLQMLQIEDQPLRLLLVRELAKVKNKDTTMVLAQRAIFDLSPEVREAAVAALQKRNPQHYLPVILQGLRYPWVPVADNAAVALCLLRAIPRMTSKSWSS
jgi:hypothetical protein